MISSVWHVINTRSLLMYNFYCSLPRPFFHNAVILRIAMGLWCEEGVAGWFKPNFLTRGLLRHLEPNEASHLARKPFLPEFWAEVQVVPLPLVPRKPN